MNNSTGGHGLDALLDSTSPISIKVLSAFLSPIVTRLISGMPAFNSYQEIQEHAKSKSWFKHVVSIVLQLGLFAMVVNGLLTDVHKIVARSYQAASIPEALGAASVVITSSPNVASLFSMVLIYAFYHVSYDPVRQRFADVDCKSFIFGEPPAWFPCSDCDSLALLAMLFGVPELLSRETLMKMDPIPRCHLVLLYVLYLPLLRLLLIVVGFPTIVAYCWFTCPMCAFLMACMFFGVHPIIMKYTVANHGHSEEFERAIDNTTRFGLVLPVILTPMIGVGTAMGVRLYLGEGYWNSFVNSMLKPTLTDYVGTLSSGLQQKVNAVFQAAR